MINNINIYKQDDLNAMITAAIILDKEEVLSAFLYCLCRAAPRCIASWYYKEIPADSLSPPAGTFLFTLYLIPLLLSQSYLYQKSS